MNPDDQNIQSLMGEMSERGYEDKYTIIPTEENFPGGYENTELQFVHFSKEEARIYDMLQNPEGDGQPFIDDEVQIRSYEPMGELIKEKGFRELFLNAAHEEALPQEALPDFKHMHAIGSEVVEQVPWMPAPGDEIPEIRELAEQGEGHDTIMVFMPSNMVFLLGQSEGSVRINPKTGFVQFGGWLGKFIRNPGRAVSDTIRRPQNAFKETIRIGATVLGAMYGGPMGATAANYAAQRLTGRNHRQAVGHAGKAGLATWGASALQSMAPSMASSGIPGLSQLGSGMQHLPQIPGLGQGMSNMGLGNLMPGMGSGGGSSTGLGNLMPGMGGSAGSGGSPGFMQGSWMSSPLVQLGLPAALNIGSGFLARKGDKEQYNLDKKERLEALRHQDERDEAYKRRSGYYDPLKMTEVKRIVNPRAGEPGEPYYLYEEDSRYEKGRHAYADGGEVKEGKSKTDESGAYDRFVAHQKHKIAHKDSVKSGYLLRGPGDGISDSIHTKVPENTFIMKARVVAMMGKGDSQAGAKALRDWIKKYSNHYSDDMKEKLEYIENGKYDVPVALSSGEVPIFPSDVYMIGGGILSKGIDILEDLQKKIDKHIFKNSSNAKYKSIDEYLGA